ncbi:hypothetical protein ACOYXV_11235 [Aeromonas veronii]
MDQSARGRQSGRAIQLGDGNQASIEQNGNGLAATVIQTGANQQVNVVQTN